MNIDTVALLGLVGIIVTQIITLITTLSKKAEDRPLLTAQADSERVNTRKIEAETVETILSSAGKAIETYKVILDKLEEELILCENHGKELESQLDDLKAEKQDLLDEIKKIKKEKVNGNN